MESKASVSIIKRIIPNTFDIIIHELMQSDIL